MTAPDEMSEVIDEAYLLDVGVALFDPNTPEDFDARDAQAIVPEVREAEANFMPYVLKNVLQSSGNWGAVRVIPRDTNAVDVIVHGRIEESNGERLRLHVNVVDATGRTWIDADYETLASKYAYEEAPDDSHDAFQSLYRTVANDMLEYYLSLAPAERMRIRNTSLLRFAAEFSPDAFGDHVVQADGRWQIRRLPAKNDPMLERMRRIREREYLFVDTLDEYYDEFHRAMLGPYNDYRQAGYEEAIAARELRQQAMRRSIAGAVAILGGIAATAKSESVAGSVAGQAAIVSGAYLVVDSFNKRAEAQFRREALMELGTSLGAEITPHVIQLENEQIRLTGTVDQQYEQWRGILKRIYADEVGLGDAPRITSDRGQAERLAAADEQDASP